MKYLLGIDQGTTQTTAVIVNERGELIEKNSAQLPARFPQAGWVEQEPQDIVRTVKEACAPLLAKYDIAAVGFDNQGETFIVWDKDTGEPVTPAIVWNDHYSMLHEGGAWRVDDVAFRAGFEFGNQGTLRAALRNGEAPPSADAEAEAPAMEVAGD